jgi:hypothetical protein
MDDELAAELKIAQSNLTLAEANSEALEEALRRRDSAAALQISRYPSGRPRAITSDSDPRMVERPGSAMGLFGLGLDGGEEEKKGGFFGLIPGKKKVTLGVEGSRSASPYRERENGWREGENSSTTVSELTEEVHDLRSSLAKLRADAVRLETANGVLEEKVKELQGKNNDLMDEFENLSVELFSEANILVANEAKARAKAEEEVERLKARLEVTMVDLDDCRNGRGGRGAGVAGDDDEIEGLTLAEEELEEMLGLKRSLTPSASSTTLNGRTYHSTTSSLIPSPALPPTAPLAVPRRLPSLPLADQAPAVSPSEELQPGVAKSWFNFGRPSPTSGLQPSSSRSTDDTPPTSLIRTSSISLEVPSTSHSMSRGDSSTSTNTTSSLSSTTSSAFSTASTSAPFPEELDDLPPPSSPPKSYILPLGSNFSTSPFNILSPTFPPPTTPTTTTTTTTQ